MADDTQAIPSSKSSDRYGLGKMLYDLKHRRRRFRQFVGVAFVFWFTFAGEPEPTGLAIGAAVFTLGMLIRFWASGYVMKNEILATVGPYGFVRHPLYVGNLTMALGICIASCLWWSYPAMALMILVFYPTSIRYEDQKLRRLFPDQWDVWAAETRALIPRTKPYGGSRNPEQPDWNLKTSLLRNGEPIHIVIGIGCLLYLYYQLP